MARNFRVSLGETAGAMKVADRFRAVIGTLGREGRGLAAYFYSRHIGRRSPRGSKTPTLPSPASGGGLVRGINEGIISTEIAPVGGMKESRIGRESSKYGIEEFLGGKYLCKGGIDR